KSEIGEAVKAALVEAGVVKAAEPTPAAEPQKSEEDMIAAAVEKALDAAGIKKEEPVDQLEDKIAKAVTAALEARGHSAQVDTENGDVSKSDATGYMKHFHG
ncbi:MAG: hypothetical protein ACQ5SW_08200, partial [Sphaerochaetaceae bacterium]